VNLERVWITLERNGITLSLSLKHQTAERFLKSAHGADLIFVDPPYDFSNSAITELLDQIPTAPESCIVLERSGKEVAPRIPNRFSLLREVSYGDTVVYFLTTGGAL
jgi:16S rRNA G966 N2-methylase RsmD